MFFQEKLIQDQQMKTIKCLKISIYKTWIRTNKEAKNHKINMMKMPNSMEYNVEHSENFDLSTFRLYL